ncbi:MAG: HDIG domain-containing protein, partial [Planctomycetota bacterium]|nr:HDIG domain-containing protein [Planctomycetota bacterium]
MNGELRKLALKRLIGKRKVSELEKWRRHSLATGVIAKTIADALVSRSVNLDAALCEAGALLHDIGRERTGGMLHGWRGYQILRKERHFLRCARFCITHWLKGRSEEEILKQGDISENLLKKILKEGDFSVLLLEDIVVCVADSMARDDVLVDIKSRYDDARRRYG